MRDYLRDYLTGLGMASQERAWLEPRPSPREVECTYDLPPGKPTLLRVG